MARLRIYNEETHGKDPRVERCCVRLLAGYEHLRKDQRPQCQYVAEPDLAYCLKHASLGLAHAEISDRKTPMTYRVMSKVLKRRLDVLNEDAKAELSLRNELALVRAHAMEHVELYDAACQYVETLEGSSDSNVIKKARELKDAASEGMLDAVKHVRKTVLDAARVEALSVIQYSPVAVREILSQVTRMMYDVCKNFENGETIAKSFDARMRDEIKLATSANMGTTITPDSIDREVLEMDSTVPMVLPADAIRIR